jgi:hypothetical protein
MKPCDLDDALKILDDLEDRFFRLPVEEFESAYLGDGPYDGNLEIPNDALVVVQGDLRVAGTLSDEILGTNRMSALVVLGSITARFIVTGQEWLVGGDVVAETLFAESSGDFTLHAKGTARIRKLFAPGHHLRVSAIESEVCISMLPGRSDLPPKRMREVLIEPLQRGEWLDVDAAAQLLRAGTDIMR